MKINWVSVIICTVFAALFPDLPLLAGRIFGYESHMPMLLSVLMMAGSALYLLAYTFGNASNGRWLASAWVATAGIGVFSGVFATLGLFGIISTSWYNEFRGFPAHLFQVATVILILFYLMDSRSKTSSPG